MSNSIRQKGRKFAEFLEGLSDDEIARGNEINFRKSQAEYGRFLEQFGRGYCYLCEKPLKTFSKKNPCIHWLLKPKGFKKKNFPAIAAMFGLFQIQSYLRWVANQAGFAKNINDLEDEGTESKIIEVTIRYENLEWALSCSESDFLGHEASKNANHPHYHFQMRVDRRQFINYNDFHLPLSEMDIINIEVMQIAPRKFKPKFIFGEGIQDVLIDEALEEIVNAPLEGESTEDAPFKLDTIAIAEEGKTISGDDLYQIIQEAKAKGKTVASLMHKLPNAKSRTFVSPGPGVVEQAPRSRRKKDAY